MTLVERIDEMLPQVEAAFIGELMPSGLCELLRSLSLDENLAATQITPEFVKSFLTRKREELNANERN